MEIIIFASIYIPVLELQKSYLTNTRIFGCLIDHVYIKKYFAL